MSRVECPECGTSYTMERLRLKPEVKTRVLCSVCKTWLQVRLEEVQAPAVPWWKFWVKPLPPEKVISVERV